MIDVSDYEEKKFEAILTYRSQFYDPNSQEVETYISDKSFLDVIRYQSAILGKSIGVPSGERFQVQRYLVLNDLTTDLDDCLIYYTALFLRLLHTVLLTTIA